jgi:hypothetical protein
MNKIPFAVALIVLFGGAAAQPAAAAPFRQGCSGNLLVNPGFDGGSRKTEGEGTSLSSAVANGWSPWFVRGDATNNREPEFKVEQIQFGGDPSRIRSGGQSMKWFTTWGTHTAGVYQRVNIRPGTPLTFHAYGMTYTGEGDGWNDELRTFLSDHSQPGNYRTSVGIDPTGAVPPIGSHPPDTVVWSAPSMTYDQWVQISVSAVARAGAVTVYLKGQPEWPVKHNDSFWEDTCLRVAGAPVVVPATGIEPPIGAEAVGENPPVGAAAAPAAPVRAPVVQAPSSAPVQAAGGTLSRGSSRFRNILPH